MKIHLVVACTDGKVDTLVKMTKSLHIAQSAMLGFAAECLGKDHEDVRELLSDFSNSSELTDITLQIKRDKESGPLLLQLFTTDIET